MAFLRLKLTVFKERNTKMQNKTYWIHLSILLGSLLPLPALAAANPPSPPTKKMKNLFFCPPSNTLKKNPKTMTWSSQHGNYKSYAMSFATELDKFLGAQWVGANVGQITCIYSPKLKTAFRVMLIFHTLTHQPTYQPKKNRWSKNLGGYFNCVSFKRKDCPFKMVLKGPSTDIYKEAEQLKSNAPGLAPPTE